jgi:hypothetical protein
MPKVKTGELFRRWVESFNGLPPERRSRRAKYLRKLLRLPAVGIALIFTRTCYFPTRQKLEAAEPSGLPNCHPRYLEVVTSTGRAKESHVVILEPAGEGCIEHDRIALAVISLEADQLFPGGGEEKFLLKMTIAG